MVLIGAGACADDSGEAATSLSTTAGVPMTQTGGATSEENGETGVTQGSESDSQSSDSQSSDSDSQSSDSQSTDSDAGSSNSDSQSSDSDAEGTKFDLGVPPDGGPGDCMGDEMSSYIWIANSEQNTISKINTKTLVEEGRYITKGAPGRPSRTSVNLAGDVVVANRWGGVLKVLAVPERCNEMNNGVPGLQTSTGGDDILEWGMDDCVQWFTPISHTSNRPIAWTAGVVDEVACTLVDTKVWTGAASVAGVGQGHVLRLDGETGSIEEDVMLTGFEASHWGPYGGAVDSQDNFWTVSLNTGNLSRVDYQTLEVSTWVAPNIDSYGFTIDEYDRPWVSGHNRVGVFDPETEQWTLLDATGTGLGQSASGTMWLATYYPNQTRGILGFDVDSLQPVQEILVPGVEALRGVSVDVDGYVWLVEVGDEAFKIDPATETWDIFDELVGAYTYSDMTGNALSLVAGGIAG